MNEKQTTSEIVIFTDESGNKCTNAKRWLIKKGLILIAAMIWGMLAFFTCYKASYDLLKNILGYIIYFNTVCVLVVLCFRKFKSLNLIREIASLVLTWSFFSLSLIECAQKNSLGAISPCLMILMSIFTLNLLVKAISTEIESNKISNESNSE